MGGSEGAWLFVYGQDTSLGTTRDYVLSFCPIITPLSLRTSLPPSLPSYDPRKYYEANAELKEAVDQIHDGFFSPEQPDLFHDIVYHLLHHDRYCLMADYESYIRCQEKVSEVYQVRGRKEGLFRMVAIIGFVQPVSPVWCERIPSLGIYII